MIKCLILSSASLNGFQQDVLRPILADPGIEITGVILDGRANRPLTLLKREIKKGRWGYLLVLVATNRLNKMRDHSVDAASFFGDIPCVKTMVLYDQATMDFIHSHQPDVIVRLGFGIIREPLLSMAPHGMLSYHHGNMRKYRGQPVGFWELYHHEPEVGVTVQRLEAGLDCGLVVAEKTIRIGSRLFPEGLRRHVFQESTALMHEALRQLQNPAFSPLRIHTLGPIYTLPTLRQWVFLYIRNALGFFIHWISAKV
jgi:folate-dependent phosphoribosylglycinamide formyltransferase PurN